MVKLDRYYLERWSIGMDLSIIARTVYVVLARKGAYMKRAIKLLLLGRGGSW